MWTGGVVPYGYRSINKKLEIEPQEADVVKFMFEMYLKYKSVMSVCKLLTENGYRDFRRDALLRMLKNPTYMGKIKYKDELYDGQHKAIISPKIFESVQYILKNKEKSERTCLFNKNEVGILRGLLTCGCCHSPMTPASCQSHGVRRFYYTSTKAKYYGYHHCSNGAIPVQLMDECILKIVTPLISDITVSNGLINKISTDKSAEIYKAMRHPEKIIEKMVERDKLQLMKLLIKGIVVNYDTIEITWSKVALSLLTSNLLAQTQDHTTIIDYPFKRNKGALILSLPEDIAQNVNYSTELIMALCKAFKYQKIISTGKQSILELAAQENIDSGYLGRLIRLTCLAPDIIKRILAGTQPAELYLQRLIREDIPPIWAEQRKLYGVI